MTADTRRELPGGTPTMTAAELAAWETSMRGGTPARMKAAGGRTPSPAEAPAVREGDGVAVAVPQRAHVHRFRFPEPDGRQFLPALCECGEERIARASFPDGEFRISSRKEIA